MSEAADVTAAALDRQRDAIELAHRAVSQGTTLQRRAMRSFVDSLDAQRAAVEGTSMLFDVAVDSSMLLARAAMPDDDAAFDRAGARFEEQLDDIDALQDSAWELYARSVEAGYESFEAYADVYADAVDASFESAIAGTEWMNRQVTGRGRRRNRADERSVDVS